MKKLSTALVLFVVFFCSNVSAQFSEIGLLGGISSYMGDLNPDHPFKTVLPAGGIFYRYNFNDRFSARSSVIIGYLIGDDANSTNEAQLERNLRFESWLFEFSLTGEFNFFRFAPGDKNTPITPFIFGGISVFNFNPTARTNSGEKFDLQPLGTEGQGTVFYEDRKKYALTTASIPFGIGIKANISKRISIGIEWGMRYTFTDYLDDVSTTYASPSVLLAERGPVAYELANQSNLSDTQVEGRQRGNSKTNDWYSFALISLSFNIKAKAQKCPAYD